MSSKTTTPNVPLDEPPAVEPPVTAATDRETITDTSGDELPFESPEFGVGAFFPHLGTPTDE